MSSFILSRKRVIVLNELIEEYNRSLYSIRGAKERANEEERKILSGMASDLEYALEWMQTGRRPGNRRGIERRAAYQRERLFDPLLMQRYFRSADDSIYEWDNHRPEHVISKWEKIQIEKALLVVTKREREIYLMSRGFCLSYGEIANHLSISRSTVQTMIERAEKKINIWVRESFFNV